MRTGRCLVLVSVAANEYELDQAVEELREGGFPDIEEMLNESLLQPIDPADVAELFEREAIDDK